MRNFSLYIASLVVNKKLYSISDLLQSKFKYLPRKLRQKLTKKRHASQQKKFDTESDWHIIEDEDYISSETELIDSDENWRHENLGFTAVGFS